MEFINECYRKQKLETSMETEARSLRLLLLAPWRELAIQCSGQSVMEKLPQDTIQVGRSSPGLNLSTGGTLRGVSLGGL